jgi:hypothetical protein
MLNDAAKMLVAREARVDIKGYRERVRLGANVDELAQEAWKQALVNHPEFREWTSAQAYFETIFYNEIDK